MKPPKGTVQWIVPHLSEGEVKAIYELVLRDVIGENVDVRPYARQIGKRGMFAPLVTHQNILKDEQRIALNKLFGMDK